jgi:hypothetical protein
MREVVDFILKFVCPGLAFLIFQNKRMYSFLALHNYNNPARSQEAANEWPKYIFYSSDKTQHYKLRQ